MTTPDDSSAPIPTDFTIVQPSSVHPLSKQLLNMEKYTPIPHFKGTLPRDDPRVAAGVLELEALMEPALSPSEVAHAEAQLAQKEKEHNSRPAAPPKSFLQAHMIIIDELLMDPTQTITKLAAKTGYSRNWLSKVMSSDAFQAKLAEKQKAICDPIVFNTIKERLQGLTSRTLDLIEERMEADNVPLATALEVFGVVSKAQGLGAQVKAPLVAQQFIVHVPPRMTSAVEWAAQHSGRPAAVVNEPLDISPDQETPE